MNSFILSSIALACLVASTVAAPAGTDNSTIDTAHPTSLSNQTGPTPEQLPKSHNITAPSSNSDVEHHFSMNTSFTCFSRPIGYYADVDQSCKVYHFCLPGEYNGEQVFQRISYLCLGETFFDQQQLDCVEQTAMKAPCKDSESHFSISNTVLRQTILGQKRDATSTSATTTASTVTPSS